MVPAPDQIGPAGIDPAGAVGVYTTLEFFAGLPPPVIKKQKGVYIIIYIIYKKAINKNKYRLMNNTGYK